MAIKRDFRSGYIKNPLGKVKPKPSNVTDFRGEYIKNPVGQSVPNVGTATDFRSKYIKNPIGQSVPNVGTVPDARQVDNTTNVIQSDPRVTAGLVRSLEDTMGRGTSVNLPRGQEFIEPRMQQLQDLYGATQQAQLERQRLAREREIATFDPERAAVENRYADLLGQIGLQEEALAPQYQRLRDESFVETLKNLRGINEAMARRGMATGGASRQAELQETLGQQRKYTDIGLSEQQARRALEEQRNSALREKITQLNRLDQGLALLKRQGEREDSALMNELEAKRLQAAMDIQNLSAERDVQIEQQEYGRGREQASDIANIATMLGNYQRGLRGEQMDVARLTGELGGRPTLAREQFETGAAQTQQQIDESIRAGRVGEIQRQQQIDFSQAVTLEELDMSKTKLIDQLQSTRLSRENQAILNKINQFNLDNLPEITKMEMAKTLQGIQRGDIENAIMNTKLEALPEQLGLEIQKMKQSIELADKQFAEAIKNNQFDRWMKQQDYNIRAANSALERAYKSQLISASQASQAKKEITDSNPYIKTIKDKYSVKETKPFEVTEKETYVDEYGQERETTKRKDVLRETGRMIINPDEKAEAFEFLQSDYQRLNELLENKELGITDEERADIEEEQFMIREAIKHYGLGEEQRSEKGFLSRIFGR